MTAESWAGAQPTLYTMKYQVNHTRGIGAKLMPGQVLTDQEVAELKANKTRDGRSMFDLYLEDGSLFATENPQPVRVPPIGALPIGAPPPGFDKGLEPGGNLRHLQELAGAASGEPNLAVPAGTRSDIPGADVMDDSDLDGLDGDL